MKWLLNRIVCMLSGHRYYVVQEFSSYSRRVVCIRCKGDYDMNDDVKSFTSWDKDFEDMYKSFGHRIIKPWRD